MSVTDRRVAIVTGATREMGIAIARKLFDDGFAVVGCGRSAAEGQRAATDIDPTGELVRFVPCDMADAAQIQAVVDATIEAFGRIDVVVNNAAAIGQVRSGHSLPVADHDVGVFEEIFRVGVTAPFILAKATIPFMISGGGGAFVHISSASTAGAVPGMTAYAPSKAALEALSNQIAVDYGPQSIRSNCVRVGMVRVEANSINHDDPVIGPMMRSGQMLDMVGQPEHVAAAVSFLAGDESEFVTGSVLVADAGMTTKQVVPDIAAGYAARKES